MTAATVLRARIASIAVLALVAGACGGADSEATTTTTATTTPTTVASPTTADPSATSSTTATTEPQTTTTTPAAEQVVIYLFVESEPGVPVITPVSVEVPAAEGPEGAAIQALIDGPEPALVEQSPPLTTSIPDGTRFLGITVNGGIAIVDLSGEFESGGGSMAMFSRLAQVVYTATRFPSIEAVEIALDGEVVTVFSGEGFDLSDPLTREFFDGTGLIPTVLLEIPAWWATVESPVPVMGTTSPEAVVDWELFDDDGLTLDSGQIRADDDGFLYHEIPVVLDRSQVATLMVTSDGTVVERVFRMGVDG